MISKLKYAQNWLISELDFTQIRFPEILTGPHAFDTNFSNEEFGS